MRGVSTQVQIVVVSINYRTTPIDIREKLSFKQEQLEEAMRTLQSARSIRENVIVSTCNRTEIYAVLEEREIGYESIKQFLAHWFLLPIETFEAHLVLYENDAAIQHVFRVSAGVDSMVVGETQILGQVSARFLQGQSIGTTKTVFNQLFREAIAFSKKAHAETTIGEKTVSIAYAAVQLLSQVTGEIMEERVLVLGAGEMSELVLKHLRANGVKQITLLSRTFSTTEKLAKRYGVQAAPMDELQAELTKATSVISATSAAKPVIQMKEVQAAIKSRKQAPYYLIDIAVPRDIDASVKDLSTIHLYDIDYIQQIVDSNLATRKKIAKQIEAHIHDEVVQFNEWLTTLQVVPVITAIQEKGAHIQQQVLASLLNKLPELTAREKKVLDNHTQSIVNQLLRTPIREVKARAFAHDTVAEMAAIENLFGLTVIEKNEENIRLATLAKERLNDQSTFMEVKKDEQSI